MVGIIGWPRTCAPEARHCMATANMLTDVRGCVPLLFAVLLPETALIAAKGRYPAAGIGCRGASERK